MALRNAIAGTLVLTQCITAMTAVILFLAGAWVDTAQAVLVCEKTNNQGKSKFKLRDTCTGKETVALDLSALGSGLGPRVTTLEDGIAMLEDEVPGVAFAGGDQDVALNSASPLVVRSITIDAPTDGYVVVTAGGTFAHHDANSAVCSITTLAAIEDAARIFSSGESVQGRMLSAFAGTRGFSVSAGLTTFNLVCMEAYTFGETSVSDSHMTAVFSPVVY